MLPFACSPGSAGRSGAEPGRGSSSTRIENFRSSSFGAPFNNTFIDEARAIDPKYGMAELLDTMLSNGLLPEWVFTDPDEGGHAL